MQNQSESFDMSALQRWINKFNSFDFYDEKPTSFITHLNNVKLVKSTYLRDSIREKCKALCQFKGRELPATQLVSINRKNMSLLSQKEYMVSHKAEGIRYMMLIVKKDRVYFLGRDRSVFKVTGITFPKSTNFEEHLQYTLLDGDMVIDVIGGVKVVRYLLFDIVTLDNVYVGDNDFRKRLQLIDREILAPRDNIIFDGVSEPIEIDKYKFWNLSKTHRVLSDKFKKSLPHKFAGVIFQPVDKFYSPGRTNDVLIWKPPELNTIKFILHIMDRKNRVNRKNLFVDSFDTAYGYLNVTDSIKRFDNKIIECRYELSSKKWIFVKEKLDKFYPNSKLTADAIFETIKNPIDKTELLQLIKGTRGLRYVENYGNA